MSVSEPGAPVRSPFEIFAAEDVRDLIAQYPLAWVVATASGEGSLLPLLGEYDAGGNLTTLLGHVGRRNPLHALLRASPGATILFTGPQGYVSPDHAERRNWGPTWNYAQLVIEAEITFEPENTAQAVDTLTDALERGRWTREELGARGDGMIAMIIAFRARVTRLTGRFKLGQDEPREVFAAILRNHPDRALVRWMERFAGNDPN